MEKRIALKTPHPITTYAEPSELLSQAPPSFNKKQKRLEQLLPAVIQASYRTDVYLHTQQPW